jgi:hypothetical protein
VRAMSATAALLTRGTVVLTERHGRGEADAVENSRNGSVWVHCFYSSLRDNYSTFYLLNLD